jgi:hypothetical protein
MSVPSAEAIDEIDKTMRDLLSSCVLRFDDTEVDRSGQAV